MSSRRFHQDETSSRRFLQDVFKFALLIRLQKTSSRRLDEDQHIRLDHTSSRRLQNVFKTSSRHPQDVLQRCLQDVSKTYYQVKLFLLNCSVLVFKTFPRRTAKMVIYRRICLGYTSEKFMISV